MSFEQQNNHSVAANYNENITYCDDDIIDINEKLSDKYRYIKYKHFIRLSTIAKKVRSKMRFYNDDGVGFTIKEVGDEYGCDYSLVSKVVNGFPNIPLKFMIGILDYLNFDLYLIVEYKNDNCGKNNDITLLLSQQTLENKLERLGYLLKQERIKREYTTSEFADILGISRPTLMRLESGYSIASLYQYFLFAEKLDIEIKIAINERNE